MGKIKFYDTNALLKLKEKVLEDEYFYISSVTLRELEHIKVSKNKTEQVKYDARRVIHILDENEDKYKTIFVTEEIIQYVDNWGLEQTPDNQICACAAYIDSNMDDDIIFVTNDICCKVTAKDYFELCVESVEDSSDNAYTGYLEVVLSDDKMAYFYEHLSENTFDLLPNQYLIIKNSDGEVVDKMRWDGEIYQNVKFGDIKSDYFGTLKPFNKDIYQQCALNSLTVNQVTMIKGKPGTGKSYLALGYLFHLLEKRKIDKIIVFCNTVATANSAKLGYLPGSRDEKLIDSSIGIMLSSKLGGIYAVEQLIDDNRLLLLPMSDIRGFDTGGMNAGVYITEAQNMDISLMKLALQRIGEDCICVIDGDYEAQVDLAQYAGANNGMRRMSEVFRGQDFYGEVELKNIYRSRIAEIAEQM